MIPRVLGSPLSHLFGRITNAYQRLTPNAILWEHKGQSFRYPAPANNPPIQRFDVLWAVAVVPAVLLLAVYGAWRLLAMVFYAQQG